LLGRGEAQSGFIVVVLDECQFREEDDSGYRVLSLARDLQQILDERLAADVLFVRIEPHVIERMEKLAEGDLAALQDGGPLGSIGSQDQALHVPGGVVVRGTNARTAKRIDDRNVPGGRNVV